MGDFAHVARREIEEGGEAAAPVDGFTGTGKVYDLTGVTGARDGTLYLREQNDIRRRDRTRN